jgi:hypothetical protein
MLFACFFLPILQFAESHFKGELDDFQSITLSDLNRMRLKIATQLMMYEGTVYL